MIVQDDELKPDVAVSKQGPDRTRQGRLRHRTDLLQYPAGDLQAGDRSRRYPHQPKRRHFQFSGKECNANFFVTSYQNDQAFGVAGKYAQDVGLRKIFLITELPGRPRRARRL